MYLYLFTSMYLYLFTSIYLSLSIIGPRCTRHWYTCYERIGGPFQGSFKEN